MPADVGPVASNNASRSTPSLAGRLRADWRRAPAAQRLAALSPALTAVLHLTGAAVVIAVPLAPPGSTLVEAAPGGLATFVGATLAGAVLLVWEGCSALAMRAAPERSGPSDRAATTSRRGERRDPAAVVRLFRLIGLFGFVRWTSAPFEQGLGGVAAGGEPTPFGATALAVFGALAALTGIGMIVATVMPRMTVPVVDANGRPIAGTAARTLQRAARIGFGALMLTLGCACIVDVVLAPATGELGLSHAIARVAAMPLGGTVSALTAAILVLCALAAAARAIATRRAAPRG